MNGRIVRIISNLYTVEIDGKLHDCHARGKFRNTNESLFVGDFCDIDIENKYILNIHKRKNSLNRPFISNVDKAMIVTSVKEPDLSLNLLDKQLAIIIFNKIKPVIIFTKLDLLKTSEKKEVEGIIKYYKSIGITCLENIEESKIKKEINDNLVVLTGQTGAGKSSLLNKLDETLNLKTSPISTSLGRGVHTTRHVELYKINNGLIADTPGFSSLNFDNMTLNDLKNSFIEFENKTCEFKDCNHLNEKNCGIKKDVEENKILKSRYENYVKFASGVSK